MCGKAKIEVVIVDDDVLFRQLYYTSEEPILRGDRLVDESEIVRFGIPDGLARVAEPLQDNRYNIHAQKIQ